MARRAVRVVLTTAVAAALALAAGVAAAQPAQAASVCTQDGSSICITSVSLSTRTLDATRPGGSVTVTLRVTAAQAPPDYVDISFGSAPGSLVNPVSPELTGNYGDTVRATRTGGTEADGIWTATIRPPAGAATTWSLSLTAQTARPGGFLSVTPSDFAASGQPTTFTTTVSAVPATPSGVRARSVPTGSIFGPIVVQAGVSAPIPTAGVGAVRIRVTPSGSCAGPVRDTGLVERTSRSSTEFLMYLPRTSRLPGTCKAVVRAVNDRGVSAGSVTVQAFIP